MYDTLSCKTIQNFTGKTSLHKFLRSHSCEWSNIIIHLQSLSWLKYIVGNNSHTCKTDTQWKQIKWDKPTIASSFHETDKQTKLVTFFTLLSWNVWLFHRSLLSGPCHMPVLAEIQHYHSREGKREEMRSDMACWVGSSIRYRAQRTNTWCFSTAHSKTTRNKYESTSWLWLIYYQYIDKHTYLKWRTVSLKVFFFFFKIYEILSLIPVRYAETIIRNPFVC